ncbi:hypothetical protein PAPHI01_1950 [Pancytospora philotis]|nr:hypothetical protein PAPHI01_1950 [Pancytospora philotis]
MVVNSSVAPRLRAAGSPNAEKLTFPGIIKHGATFKPISLDAFPNSFFRGFLLTLGVSVCIESVMFALLYAMKGSSDEIASSVFMLLRYVRTLAILNISCFSCALLNRWLLGDTSLARRDYLLFCSILLYVPLSMLLALKLPLLYFIYVIAMSSLASYYVNGCMSMSKDFEEMDEDRRFKFNILITIETMVIVSLLGVLVL